MTSKIVLVVGGAGFIGSEVNQLLYQSGYETVVFDNLSHGHQQNVKWGTFIQGDINHPDALEKLFKTYSFDAVMHFAALIDVGESVINPSIYYKNNVLGTLYLLNAMKDHGVKTFIFSSSAAVYGIPKTRMLTEDDPKNPINPYGRTKLIIEEILNDFDTAYGIKSAKLRYFNAAGGDPEGQIKNYNQKHTNLIPIVLAALKSNQPITINGTDYATFDGTCVRDYIHIYDLGIAHVKAMEKLFFERKSDAYNLGNGNGFSVREVISIAEKVTGKKVPIIEGKRRAGDPAFLLADASKAKKNLDWQPQYTDLETIITHAWETF